MVVKTWRLPYTIIRVVEPRTHRQDHEHGFLPIPVAAKIALASIFALPFRISLSRSIVGGFARNVGGQQYHKENHDAGREVKLCPLPSWQSTTV